MNERDAPIVFCHGLFGWGPHELGGYPYFFCAKKLKDDEGTALPPFLFPATGPVSSLHDQACELFYQLKGGRVNYGREHSEKHGHARYSRDYTLKALYPEWGESRPLDFVAHSMGAPVVRMLQYLLATGFFSTEDGIDYGTSSRWIRSLTSIAGVHNGSTLAWILGADENTGLLRKNAILVRFLASLLERYEKISLRYGKLDEVYDLQLDQWEIASGQSASATVAAIFATPEFAEGEDWAMYDLTPNAMSKWNAILREYDGTRYSSCVTRTTFSLFGLIELPIPFCCHWFLVPFSFSMGHRYGRKNWANDGMCPSSSQIAPTDGRETVGVAVGTTAPAPTTTAWQPLMHFNGTDHAEIAMLPHAYRVGRGKRIYGKILRTIIESRKDS